MRKYGIVICMLLSILATACGGEKATSMRLCRTECTVFVRDEKRRNWSRGKILGYMAAAAWELKPRAMGGLPWMRNGWPNWMWRAMWTSGSPGVSWNWFWKREESWRVDHGNGVLQGGLASCTWDLRDEAKFSLAESGGKIFVNNYSLSEKGGFSTNLDNIYSCSIAEKRRQGGLGGIDVLVCYRSNEPDGLNYYYMATARWARACRCPGRFTIAHRRRIWGRESRVYRGTWPYDQQWNKCDCFGSVMVPWVRI